MNDRQFTDTCGDVYEYLEACVAKENYGEADRCNRKEIISQLCKLQRFYGLKIKSCQNAKTMDGLLKVVACIQTMMDEYKHAHLQMVRGKIDSEIMFSKTRAADEIVDTVARIPYEMDTDTANADDILDEFETNLGKLKSALTTNAP